MEEKKEIILKKEIEKELANFTLAKELLQTILKKEDYFITPQGKKERKAGGWEKAAYIFRISTEILEEKQWESGKKKKIKEDEIKEVIFYCKIRAKMPTKIGERIADASGLCSTFEYIFERNVPSDYLHKAKAKAETRARTRAIKTLINIIGTLDEEEEEFKQKLAFRNEK